MNERKRYRKNQRLHTADIVAMLAAGRAVKRPGFTVLLKANTLGAPRLGLIIPKRVLPRAVDRNRIKRALREWFRHNQTELGSRDILVRLTAKSAEVGALSNLLVTKA